MLIWSHDELPRVWKKKNFLPSFIVANAKSTASLFNSENSDPPPRNRLFIVHKSENYIEELERGRWVKSPCASPAHQIPLLKHHSHTHTPLIYQSCLHPYSQERRPDSVRARCSLRAAILVPKWRSTHAQTFTATATATALNTTRTRAHSCQALNLKLAKTCSGIKAEPVKGDLPCMFDIILRRNCWQIVIIFYKWPKYLCTSIPTRNDAEHLSSLYTYLFM